MQNLIKALLEFVYLQSTRHFVPYVLYHQ